MAKFCSTSLWSIDWHEFTRPDHQSSARSGTKHALACSPSVMLAAAHLPETTAASGRRVCTHVGTRSDNSCSVPELVDKLHALISCLFQRTRPAAMRSRSRGMLARHCRALCTRSSNPSSSASASCRIATVATSVSGCRILACPRCTIEVDHLPLTASGGVRFQRSLHVCCKCNLQHYTWCCKQVICCIITGASADCESEGFLRLPIKTKPHNVDEALQDPSS